jgi:soluble lytic murein transglycosylase-like protein
MDGHFCPALRTALIGGALALAPCAQAQVLEVGPRGVTTISGPAVITDEGAQPIVMPKASPITARPAVAATLDRAGAAHDLSGRLLEAIAYVESRFNPAAVSPKGAVGMMQLMPATASELGVDARNPDDNARGGASYMRKLLAMFDNDVQLALAAYNAGPDAVKRYGGVPPYKETRAYVAAVMDYLAETSVPEVK